MKFHPAVFLFFGSSRREEAQIKSTRKFWPPHVGCYRSPELFQLLRNLLTQQRGFGNRPFCLAALHRLVAEGNGLERNLSAGNGCVRAHGTLAAAAHAAQKRAFR